MSDDDFEWLALHLWLTHEGDNYRRETAFNAAAAALGCAAAVVEHEQWMNDLLLQQAHDLFWLAAIAGSLNYCPGWQGSLVTD